MQPVLAGLRAHRRAAPGDLRAAVRRLDRGLLVLVPDQRPAQRLAPEVPDRLRAVAGQRADEPAVGEEVVARLDDAELVALGVGEHDVALLGRWPTSRCRPPSASARATVCLLVVERRAGQVEVHLVRPGLRLLRRAGSGSGTRCRRSGSSATPSCGRRPAPSPGHRPRSARAGRVVGVEAERVERRHRTTLGPRTRAGPTDRREPEALRVLYLHCGRCRTRNACTTPVERPTAAGQRRRARDGQRSGCGGPSSSASGRWYQATSCQRPSFQPTRR